MKKALITLIKSIVGSSMSSKVKNPIEWKFISHKIGILTYELHLIAIIEYPWRLYAHHSVEDGSLTAIIKFQENRFVNFSGKPKLIGHLKEVYDKALKTHIHYYATAVDFVQRVEIIIDLKKIMLEGDLIFMLFKNDQCFEPKKVEFQIELN